jgi:hypothetical protein
MKTNRAATKTILLLIVFLSCLPQAYAGETPAPKKVQGYVFHDANKNQKKDPKENGLQGIMVSNGVDIITTREDGYYEIAIEADMTVFVIKPSHWMTPLDPHNIPQFHYTYRPDNSNATSAQLPERINFPLYKNPESDTFEIFIFGDTQTSNIKEIKYLARSIITETAGDTIRKFGITLGDIVNDNIQDYPLINQLTKQIGIPWYYIAGNHDINFDAPSERLTTQTFEDTYGPSTFAFQYGNTHFILFDDVIYTGNKEQRYIGGIRDDQFRFIENYLSIIPKDELIVLCTHIPIFKEEATYYEGVETFRVEDKYQLFSLLEEFPHTFSMSAHTHFVKQYFFNEEEGWKQEKPHHHFNAGAVCGDWYKGLYRFDGYPDATMRDGTPLGFAILSIEGNQYKARYKVQGANDNKQTTLHYDKGQLYVNYYMGSDSCRVYYRNTADDEWIEMEQSIEPDPRTLFMHQQIKTSLASCGKQLAGRQISDPQPCGHLWKATIHKLPSGFHTVKIKVLNMYQEKLFDQLVFFVE